MNAQTKQHIDYFARLGTNPSQVYIPGKTGKKPARTDYRLLHLAKYLTKATPVPPVRAGYVDKVQNWPMYLNDQLGCCVISAAGHMISEWTAYSGIEADISDQDVLVGYQRVGGYMPGKPETDNGCYILDALTYWAKTGFGSHKIWGFVSVNPFRQQEVQTAIHLFGNVYVGINLPLSAQYPINHVNRAGLPCWEVPDYGTIGYGSPGTWGGHCVPIIGYSNDQQGNPGTMVVTWGQRYDMTWNFVRAYCDEMYCIITQDWIDKNGKSPTGLNLSQLAADIEYVRSLPRR